VLMRNYQKCILMTSVVWAVSFVLLMLAYFLVISPRLEVKAQLAKELVEKQQMYDAAVNAAQDDNKKKLADEVEVLKSKLGDYAVESDESANLTFDIGRIAADKQVGSFTIKTPDQMRDSDQSDSKYLQENRIDIAFASNFKQFAAFLNAIERHRPVIFVDKFKVSRGEQGGTSNKVDMGLSVFVRKRPEG
jgi:Tfp pilus assembly protein PilO